MQPREYLEMLPNDSAEDVAIEMLKPLIDSREFKVVIPIDLRTPHVDNMCNPEQDFEGLANVMNFGDDVGCIYRDRKMVSCGNLSSNNYFCHSPCASTVLNSSLCEENICRSIPFGYGFADETSEHRIPHFCEYVMSFINSIDVSLQLSPMVALGEYRMGLDENSVYMDSVSDDNESFNMDSVCGFGASGTVLEDKQILSDASESDKSQYGFCTVISKLEPHSVSRIVVSRRSSTDLSNRKRKRSAANYESCDTLSFVAASCLTACFENDTPKVSDVSFETEVRTLDDKVQAVPLRTRKGFRKPIPVPEDVTNEDGGLLYDSCRREWKVFWYEEGKMKYRAYQCKKYGKKRAQILAQSFVREKMQNL